MDTNQVFGEILEQGQNTAQNVKKSAVQQTKAFVNSTSGQVTGKGSGINEQVNAQQQKMSDDQAQQFLKDLYGKSDQAGAPDSSTGQKPKTQSQSVVQQITGITPPDPNAGKTPEELAKIQSLRQELHQDYYQNLVNPPKQQEEHVTEKLEREEQQAQFEEIEKDKKKPQKLPQTIKTGTGESVVGISG